MRFSDDTVLYLAVAHATMEGLPYHDSILEFGRRHRDVGFARGFTDWLANPSIGRRDSWGNGSAMRVGSVAWLARDMQETVEMAEATAIPTHGHPEGVKGAVAVAVAVRTGIEGGSPDDIRFEVTMRTGYNLFRTVDSIRADYPRFQVSCLRSVPEAIVCALEAASFEDAIRNAISLGNDADTQASIAGAIAETMFEVPAEMKERCLPTLTPDLAEVYTRLENRMLEIRGGHRSAGSNASSKGRRLQVPDEAGQSVR